MLGFRSAGAAGALAALAIGGCADLGTLGTPACGDGVVESGEDCDQTDATTSGNACGQSGGTNACRFICATSIACPTGWACGLDGACKLPIPGSFSTIGPSIPQGPATDLLVGDFDSDGVTDIVAVAPPTVDLHFFETTHTSTNSTSIIAATPNAAVGALTPSTSTPATVAAPSLALDLSRGLGVFTGQTDRSLASEVFASVTFTGSDYRVAAFLSGTTELPTKPTGFFAYGDRDIYTFMPPGPLVPLDTFSATATRVGAGAVGRFVKGQLCDWIALALDDTDGGHVHVYSPCSGTGTPVADLTFMNAKPMTKIPACEAPALPCVPVTAPFHPVYLADVDGDGLTDIIVASDELGGALHVAYSYGNQHFGATPPSVSMMAVPVPDNTFSPPLVPLIAGHGVPLAVGDVNGDGIVDIVDPTGIYPGVGGPPTITLGPAAATPDGVRTWSEAVIADLNGDGRPDVAVGSSDYSGITLYRSAPGGFFNPVDIGTAAPVKDLAVGDLDGDFVDDLVFAAIGPPSTDSTADAGTGDAGAGDAGAASTVNPDTVYVSFGVLTGPPADPVAIGEVTGVSQIVTSYESQIYSSLIEDAFVVSLGTGSPSTSVYLFPGDTSRQIETPYYLIPPSASAGIDGPRRSVVGSFTGRAGHADLAVFAVPGTCTMNCSAHLWLLPTIDDGDLEAASTGDASTPQSGSKLQKPFDTAADALVGELDAPPGGTLHQAILATISSAGGGTSLLTATAAATAPEGAQQFVAGTPVTMVTPFDLSGDPGSLDGKMLTVDVDGEGHRDVVLVSANSGLAVLLWSAATNGIDAATPALTLKYGELTSVCGATPVKPPGPGTAAGPGKQKTDTIGAAAFAKGTYGAGQAIVVVVSTGTVMVEYDGKKLVPSCLKDIATGTAVAVGDFDGDGIEDIAVSQSDGLAVYYANAEPAGPRYPATADGGAP